MNPYRDLIDDREIPLTEEQRQKLDAIRAKLDPRTVIRVTTTKENK
jgi:hypothetical protein